jgi:hypothetical protein
MHLSTDSIEITSFSIISEPVSEVSRQPEGAGFIRTQRERREGDCISLKIHLGGIFWSATFVFTIRESGAFFSCLPSQSDFLGPAH